MVEHQDTIIVTGSTGFIGSALINKFAGRFALIGLDRATAHQPPPAAECVCIDLTSEQAVAAGLRRVRTAYGNQIASVILLASYFDLTGEPNPLYDEITVHGTEKLLRALQSFEVEQFVFDSSMLAHKEGRRGDVINEDSPLQSNLPYRTSKIEAEHLIHEQHGPIPVVYLHPAGIYDDLCRNAFLDNQIARVYEKNPTGHLYPGDLRTGQSFLHLDDLTDAVSKLIERRKELPPELALLLGEPDIIGYGDLQAEIGRLIHGEPWETREIPKALAKAGARVQRDILGEESFIRPWMVDIADDHYAVDISRASKLLGWGPQHSLPNTLPKIIASLKADPSSWYRANKLNTAQVADRGAKARERVEHFEAGHAGHMAGMGDMDAMASQTLWAHFLVVALGVWLVTSPFQFALFDPAAASMVRDVTQERGLWEPALRNALTGWNDMVCGLLLMLSGSLALSPRFSWAQWGTTVIGLWLLFAPLFFWTPSAAAYGNDTIIGALAIVFSVLIPMMPGMSREGMMDESTVPPGWTYSPSSWLQCLPMIALGFFGFLIARRLTSYQLGQIGAVWDPFFSGGDGKNGTEFIITSSVSRAWPIPDAGLGAAAYMIETLMGAMGSASRWRTMPWMVTFFFILVVPLGGVSIFFIIIQPIMIGTYCTLCLLAAAAMLVMIPPTLDELVAMAQYMLRSVRAGRPFWRTFFQGGPEPNGAIDENDPGFSAALVAQSRGRGSGRLPALDTGRQLRRRRLADVFEADLRRQWRDRKQRSPLGRHDHHDRRLHHGRGGPATPVFEPTVRAWLLVAPWLLAGAATGAVLNDMAAGCVVITLSLPRGRISKEHYGAWDRYVA